jgi:VWFA-related protein
MRVVLAVALALSLAPSHQTTTAAPERTPVRVDAIAADARGRIVDDLAPADFEVSDDGGTRTIESVRLIKAEGSAPPGQVLQPILSAADEQREAAREGTRLFAFFLDEYHVTAGAETTRAREAMGRFVDTSLGPRDLVLVVKPLDSLIALRLTRDLETARRAIATFEGRKGELEPRNAFEKNYIGANPARIEAVREQIVTSALNAVATHLAGLGASRKTLVVVSEGFGQAQRRRGDESLPTLESVIRSANRAGASIYAIDPRGLVAAPSSAGDVGQDTEGQDALLALSNETGGRAILRPADPADELSHIAREASSYYLITFQSEREADGRFHPLDVKVRRAGVQLRVRRGYWATLADSVWRSRMSTSAEAVRPPELPRRTSPLIRPWFGLSRGDDGKTRVSFVWEPAARVPGDRSRPLTPVRITLKALKPDGTLVFEGAVRPTGPVIPAGAGDEPPRAVFEAAPGRLRVQMSIEDAASRVVDTDVREVVVGPLSGPLVLGTPEVLRASNARAYRALEADATVAPVAARAFSRSERLLIRVPVYDADQSAILKANLASKPGTSMRALPVTRSSRPDVYQVDLPLAGLAAGDYVVELTAKSPSGSANDVIAFRVTP